MAEENSNNEKILIESDFYHFHIDKSLKIDKNILVKEIISAKIVRELNNHTSLSLVINRENNEDFKKIGSIIELVSVQGSESTEKLRTVFFGVITNIDVLKGKIIINAKSISINIDKEKICKTYQNYILDAETIYTDISGFIKEKNSIDVSLSLAPSKEKKSEKKEEELSIQYNETHWEFLKRTASKVGLSIINNDLPENKDDLKIGAIIGMLEENELTKRGKINLITDKVYYNTQKRDGKELIKLTFNGFVNPGEYIELEEVTSPYLTTKAIITYNYENKTNNLDFEYFLTKKSEYKVEEIINKDFVGKSCQGKVEKLGIEETLGKVALNFKFGDILEVAGKAEYSFIDCATMYSGNKSGVFIMPEIADLLFVYFPDGKEKNCYVTGALKEVLDPNFHDINQKTIIVGDEKSSNGIIISKTDKQVKIAGNHANTKTDSTVYIKVKSDGIDIVGDEGNKVMIKMDKETLLIKNKDAVIEMKADKITINAGTKSGISVDSSSIVLKSGSSSLSVDSSGIGIKASKFSAN